MLKNGLSIAVFFAFQLHLFAGIDSTYVKKINSNLTLRSTFKTENQLLLISPKGPFNYDGLVHQPNLGYQAGVGLFVKGIGANIFYNLPETRKPNEIYGKPKYTSIDLSITTRSLLIGSYYRKYSGQYMEDNGEIIKRPDLSTTSMGFEIIGLIGAKKFSIKSALIQTEKQLKSAGAFLMKGSLAADLIRSNSPVIPANQADKFQKAALLKNASIANGGFGFGYGYNFVAGGFYFMPALISGANLQTRFIQIPGLSRISIRPATFSDIILAFGYNGSWFFTGIKMNSTIDKFTVENTTFRFINYQASAFLGLRF